MIIMAVVRITVCNHCQVSHSALSLQCTNKFNIEIKIGQTRIAFISQSKSIADQPYSTCYLAVLLVMGAQI